MIVNRMVFNFQPGKVSEAAALVRAGPDYGLPETPHGMRMYRPNVSSYDQLIIEVEFEDLAQHAAYWEAWFASPRADEWSEKWQALRAPGVGEEILNLETLK